MPIPLTFTDKTILETTVVGPEGTVHYTTTNAKPGWGGRQITIITAASGLVGSINWREKTFVINGVQRAWDDLKSRSGAILSSEQEWNWGNRPFKLKYQNSHKELLATSTAGNTTFTVRFTPYRHHVLHDNERAVIYFPPEMQDEGERMFVLMAILQTEIHRLDVRILPLKAIGPS
ncbi:hypothetical protein B0H19DRAFT_1248862 [Mycena capillaripes]|nr:hypothetical protein B0H19DRAFT_1248862 [Mycena capillaripes]